MRGIILGENQRKRGKELLDTIFSAAIDLLENQGYDAVTFQNVATKAHTSRSVLYRRWKTPFDLLYEATNERVLSQRTSLHEVDFNTGSLRGDLIAVLSYMFANIKLFPKNMIPAITLEVARGRNVFNQGYFADNQFIDKIFADAVERGEIHSLPSKLQKDAFFQLQRYYMTFEYNNINSKLLTRLVDEVLLPLYRN